MKFIEDVKGLSKVDVGLPKVDVGLPKVDVRAS